MVDPPQAPTRTLVDGFPKSTPSRGRKLSPAVCVPNTAGFFEVVEKSRLVEDEILSSLRRRFADRLDAPPHEAATHLAEKGWVTRWQSQQLLAGKTLFFLGRYRFVDRIGMGGMGAVFKAEHQMMDRVVALKVIRRSLLQDPKTLQRFLREIKAVASLVHPNIVTAHDADCVGDTYFLVMEYINGKDLDWWVRRHGPFPVKWACDFCRQTALGLQHAYEQGLCHRDIKPKNLLAASENQGKAPVIKILDFGLARLFSQDGETNSLDQSADEEGLDDAVIGTFGFMAPEQIRSPQEIDIRSDIFALGCTLFYLLTGGLPFRGDTETKLLSHLFDHKAPLPLRRFAPHTPPAVEQIVNKMLAFRMEDRFQSPQEVADVLAPFSALTIKSFAGANTPIPLPAAAKGPKVPLGLQAGIDLALGEFSHRLTDHPIAAAGANIESLINSDLEPAPEFPALETTSGWSLRTVQRGLNRSSFTAPLIAILSGALLIGALIYGMATLNYEKPAHDPTEQPAGLGGPAADTDDR